MRRVCLVVNPAAGRQRDQRLANIARVRDAISAHGITTDLRITTQPGDATRFAREAVLAGTDAVFACGGDGTVHEVLQALVGQHATALGVIPMGSSNALARHLRLPKDAVAAALQQLKVPATSVPVGRVEYGPTFDQQRYFLVMAGAGPDGFVAQGQNSIHKQRVGSRAYDLHAARLFLTRPMQPFRVTWLRNGEEHSGIYVSAMAVRVRDLGGILSPLIRGGDLHQPRMRLHLVRPPAWLSLPLWFASAWTGLSRFNPLIEHHEVDCFTCTPTHTDIPIQTDAEFLSTLPMRVTLPRNAVSLLAAQG